MMATDHVTQFFTDANIHSGIWLNYLTAYVSIPNKLKNAEAFLQLDSWYHNLDVSRGFITKAELVEIMRWKLMRGKMRPLLKQIEALSEEDVQSATYAGFNMIREGMSDGHLRAALDAITKPLKGVGPATASAVLAKWNHAIPFMSDAGLLAVNGKLDYTISAFIKYHQGISAKVVQLNADGQSQHQWNAKQVEAVLHIVYSRHDLKLPL